VCGSRTITDEKYVFDCITNSKYKITEIVSGRANGVDQIGENYAQNNSIPVRVFLPDWKRNGTPAGIIRDKEMVNYCDAVIAVWDGSSKGTKFTIDYAKKMKKPLKVWVK